MTERKKILLVTAGYPYGNWERGFLTTEMEHLRKRFDVTVLAVGREDPLLYDLPEGVKAERYLFPKLPGLPALAAQLARPEVFREVLRAVKGVPVKTALKRAKMICAWYTRAKQVEAVMARLLRREKTDLLYTYWCNEPAIAAALLKKKNPELRFITRFHGHDLFRERKASAWQPFKPFIAKYADRLVFACRMGKEYFESTWGAEEKTRLCYLGSADSGVMDHQASDTLRLVSCSNLIPLKRVDRIIDAISALPEGLRVTWDHFGDGSEEEALKARAAERFGENITWTFHGRVPNHLLSECYREIDPDLFLTASSTEGGAPVSIQEVFSMGISAVGTAVGGIPELIEHGVTGLLLPENATAEQLKDAILTYYNLPPAEKAAMSAAARALWERCFDAEQNAKTFVESLQSLLQES